MQSVSSRFELVSPCPFPTTITITPQAPHKKVDIVLEWGNSYGVMTSVIHSDKSKNESKLMVYKGLLKISIKYTITRIKMLQCRYDYTVI